MKRSGPNTTRSEVRWQPCLALQQALSPSSMRFAGHWLAVRGWGGQKGLGRRVACKLLYSRTQTHTPLMWGRVVVHNLLLYAHYHNVFYLGLCALCAWPAVRNHLRRSYFLSSLSIPVYSPFLSLLFTPASPIRSPSLSIVVRPTGLDWRIRWMLNRVPLTRTDTHTHTHAHHGCCLLAHSCFWRLFRLAWNCKINQFDYVYVIFINI